MGKPTKRTKKFISTKLDSHIQARKQHQKKKKLALVNAERRAKAAKSKPPGSGGRATLDEDELRSSDDGEADEDLPADSDDGQAEAGEGSGKGRKALAEMSVDEFLAHGLDGVAGDEDDDHEDEDVEDLEDLEELEDESDEEGDHIADLTALAKKDPDFFKYLQENDADLLNFNPDVDMASASDDDKDSANEDEGLKGTKANPKSKHAAAEAIEKQVVTLSMLREWQRAILQQRSLRAMRRLLLAFRAAAQLGASTSSAPMPAGSGVNADESAKEMSKRKRKALKKQRRVEQGGVNGDGEGGGAGGYIVQDARVYQKVIQTTLKYTPLVLAHHVPYKEISKNGASSISAGTRYKLPTQSKKYAMLQRPIQSFFYNLTVLLRSLPDGRKRTSSALDDGSEDDEGEEGGKKNGKGADGALLGFVVEESSRMIPYIVGNQKRKMARDYIKIMLDLWSSAADGVRVSSFLAVRKMAAAGDADMLDLCLKGTYHAFVRSTKLTTAHTLPSINLMKNSASQLFLLDLTASYQHAFGFIRQLAIHLRNCLQNKSKEAYQNVYNWQYVHCLDFWSLVLSATCDRDSKAGGQPQESPMEPLIYPLVQVSLGAIRLIPTSRYFPLRLHIIRSLLRLVQRTGTYIPLAPYLIEMLDAPEFQRKAKASTLKPLDLTTNFRAPAAYLRTSVYADHIGEEVAFLLLEFLGSQARSLAFPELCIPVTVQLRRLMKTFATAKPGAKGKGAGAGKGKADVALKHLLDKVAQQVAWTEKRRQGIDYAPASAVRNGRATSAGKQAAAFLKNEQVEAPLEAALRLARKVRAQKRQLLEQSKIQIDG
ncbi:Noc2-domain-containing protein [Tilletiaria anomala UBC 951]|uniref:Noc2-domain-containing protein n=1 Tax=Tilletiaria anomala (strain ATCC 24038 / CBS 436.72 / UBC 951) TaxID=1037660 RepID=A0A066WA79_TILAU|nr:Noc2-domain-containing protein [Tilletiaria anomala UBC 951]KDN47984.1 Noc2-domain-containing protein [Tilletiaria anomala UBC 951]